MRQLSAASESVFGAAPRFAYYTASVPGIKATHMYLRTCVPGQTTLPLTNSKQHAIMDHLEFEPIRRLTQATPVLTIDPRRQADVLEPVLGQTVRHGLTVTDSRATASTL